MLKPKVGDKTYKEKLFFWQTSSSTTSLRDFFLFYAIIDNKEMLLCLSVGDQKCQWQDNFDS